MSSSLSSLDENMSQKTASTTATTTKTNTLTTGKTPQYTTAISSLLTLPLELRLQIYKHLFPPRHHKIAGNTPSTPYFYNSPRTLITYTFGHSPPLTHFNTKIKAKSPNYLLTTNSHASLPHPSIHPAILRTGTQILHEALPMLYSSSRTVWDFGTHIEAVESFFGARDERARTCVKSLRIAFELPVSISENPGLRMADRKMKAWDRMVRFVCEEMTGLERLDLTLWWSDGSCGVLPVRDSDSDSDLIAPSDEGFGSSDTSHSERRTMIAWRESPFTSEILSLPSLISAKITEWTARPPTGIFGTEGKMWDSWAAERMVVDPVLRERMVKKGVVGEEVWELRF
ncbi:hypothetical protein QTJ16_004195 [Diplocarpon rosae]|uniref:DUF7730 domain-containing protein n=1 Tax=Diplocarpon rosae TaxID=946125 RepID=A0AAD9T2B3_9HELO|nr:hypothetical protein QTJ16_004195 [Diplocarpon rosae]